MTTRQHLIEQDCMDILGWGVDRVANSTDNEMLDALSKFKRIPPCVPPKIPSLQSVQGDNPTVLPTVAYKSDNSMIDRLRDSIRLKTLCISSDDLLVEDVTLLQTSIERDNHTLTNELNSIRDQLDKKRLTESKKYKIRNLLQKVVHSVGDASDVAHLKEVDVQLSTIKEDIKRLNQALS